MLQREITKKQKLLNADGNINQPGYAKRLVWEYNRNAIIARKASIKEWDYYYIGNDEHALCLTIADMGYIGALSASVLNFSEQTQINKSAICLFPMGKFAMPATSVMGDCKKTIGGVEMTFTNDGKVRHLFGKYAKFGNKGEDLSFDIIIKEFPRESMVIATPFEKKGRFYYNQKINCMSVDGFYTLGKETYTFCKENKAMATLDWGRGVWTYENTWYWGSLQTYLDDGAKFGFNIGYGFGNNEKATENMLFYNGKSHKLDEVVFNIPQKNGEDDFMSPWTFTSNDGRFTMDFTPVLDRYAPVNIGVFAMIPHQVFGKFNGTATLDDGTVITVVDKLGFAEKVHNKW